jgi:hypothetical protein
MEADSIVFWFSVFVSICVSIWAIVVITTYNKIGKK